MSTLTEAMTDSPGGRTRVERMRQPLAADVVAAVADAHGVCIRPFTMEVGDPATGELRYVPPTLRVHPRIGMWPVCA